MMPSPDPSALALLARRLKWTCVQNFAFSVFAAALAVGMVLVTVSNARSKGFTGQTFFMGFAALVFFAAGWGMFSEARKHWPPTRSRVYRMLASDGADIVWAHLTTGSMTAIKVYFFDGQLTTIYGGKRDVETLLHFVIDRVPDVIRGYGPQQQAAYAEIRKAHRKPA